jgi:hypothetical protein
VPERQRYRLPTIGDPQLGQNVANMRSGSSEADAQPLGDLWVVQPLNEKNQHLAFARG